MTVKIIDMNKPYVGFIELSPNEYQLYIVTWPNMGPNRGPEYRAQRLGEPVNSISTAQGTLDELERLTGVQNAYQLNVRFFPRIVMGDESMRYIKPTGLVSRKA